MKFVSMCLSQKILMIYNANENIEKRLKKKIITNKCICKIELNRVDFL